MLIIVDPHSGVPVYRQMMDQIRFQIASGALAPGDEIPSTRALSQRLGVNPMTVSKAYSLLEEEGIVERRPGLPLVVADRAAADVDHDRGDQLARVLEPAAVAARQLGMSTTKAVSVFRRLLEHSNRTSETPR